MMTFYLIGIIMVFALSLWAQVTDKTTVIVPYGDKKEYWKYIGFTFSSWIGVGILIFVFFFSKDKL